jgi:hypothetical protein
MLNLFFAVVTELVLRIHEKAPRGQAGGAPDRFRCEVPDESGAHRHQFGTGASPTP